MLRQDMLIVRLAGRDVPFTDMPVVSIVVIFLDDVVLHVST